MNTNSAVNGLGALAHKTRLEIFRLLVQAGPVGLHVKQIGERLGVPGATLAHHLNQLKLADLLITRQENRFVYHAANFQTVNSLLAFLTENCCGGQPICTAPGLANAYCLPHLQSDEQLLATDTLPEKS